MSHRTASLLLSAKNIDLLANQGLTQGSATGFFWAGSTFFRVEKKTGQKFPTRVARPVAEPWSDLVNGADPYELPVEEDLFAFAEPKNIRIRKFFISKFC